MWTNSFAHLFIFENECGMITYTRTFVSCSYASAYFFVVVAFLIAPFTIRKMHNSTHILPPLPAIQITMVNYLTKLNFNFVIFASFPLSLRQNVTFVYYSLISMDLEYGVDVSYISAFYITYSIMVFRIFNFNLTILHNEFFNAFNAFYKIRREKNDSKMAIAYTMNVDFLILHNLIPISRLILS